MKITFDGGLNENDGAKLNECQEGANFDLVYGDTRFTPRKPLDLKGTLSGGYSIAGIMQLVKKDDTETTLIYDDNPGGTSTIYLWDGADTFTSKRTTNVADGSKLRSVYYALTDRIAIVDINLLTPLLTWGGSTCDRHKTGLSVGSPTTIGTSLTSSGTTATVDHGSAHGLSTGDLVIIAGANETEYNGEYEITVTGANTFTYIFAGSGTSPATGTITFDRGVDLYAKYAVIHNGRQWLFNVKTNDGSTDSENPHLIAVSAFEDIESYDTSLRNKNGSFTGNEAFYMLTRDLKPINGVVLFNKELVISTVDGRLYRLIGNDSTNYDWVEYYGGSSAIGTETMVNFGNDVALMRKGGRIDTLRATDASSDVTVDDISRWLPISTKGLTDAITCYDNDYQKVYFFVTGKALVLYKENLYGTDSSPWSVYRTELDFRFNVNCAERIRRPGLTSYSVYVGGENGKIYDINGTGDGDEGTTAILSFRRNNLIEELDTKNGLLNGSIHYRRIGQVDVTLECDWSEEYNVTKSVITLKGRGPSDSPSPYYGGSYYYGGSIYYNGGFQFEGKPSKQSFSPGGKGPSFFLETSVESVYSFQIDHIILGT